MYDFMTRDFVEEVSCRTCRKYGERPCRSYLVCKSPESEKWGIMHQRSITEFELQVGLSDD